MASTLLHMATGLGKTVVMSHIAARWPKHQRVLLMAHREELIFQAARTFERGKQMQLRDYQEDAVGRVFDMLDVKEDTLAGAWNPRPDIEMGAFSADLCSIGDRSQVVIASVQTLTHRRGTRRRIERFDPKEFGLILTDEAHHAAANSYQAVYEYFADAHHVGVTATPDRNDRRGLGCTYDSIAYSMGIREAIDAGWLVRIHQKLVRIDSLDMRRIRTRMGDLADNELEQLVSAEVNINAMMRVAYDSAQGRRALVYLPGVGSATRAAEILNRYRNGCAAVVHGGTSREDRRHILHRYQSGHIQFLCNCLVLTEGFDAPATQMIVNCRPTKSRSLYAQILGRGTRPLPGLVDGEPLPEERRKLIAASDKPACCVIDFTGASGKHKLVYAVELLATDEHSDQVRRRVVKRTMQEGELPLDVMRAIEEERIRERRAIIKARANFILDGTAIRYTATDVDPFGIPCDVKSGRRAEQVGTITERQLSTLRKAGYPPKKLHCMSSLEASEAIDTMIRRSKSGLCTYRQFDVLRKFYGDKCWEWTMSYASSIISRLARSGWRHVNL